MTTLEHENRRSKNDNGKNFKNDFNNNFNNSSITTNENGEVVKNILIHKT